MTRKEKYIAACRKSIEKLYDDTCNIYESGMIKDPKTKITKPTDDILVVENQQCRISFKTISPTNQTESNNKTSQEIKLFIAPELLIKEGSKIVITRNGRTTEYRNSGTPAIYSTHQEIILTLVKEYA
ncbi:hypothetical protein [Fusobacterium ulcerans]|uniref:hypothetical protein n=1 Tax=Fusobacterium ulcerans TaxID=861 RepID=UPI0027B9B136|nr:hypothetical protein [Fusobacterium ulcerans]